MAYNFFKTLCFFAILALAFSCATIVSPTGGPADNVPPKIISATPKDSTLNFSSQKIVLEFDEFVKLNNPSSQVMVNPFLKEKPEFSIKGKKVIITIKDTLKANTTYHLFLGDAIKDITEGNSSAIKEYVFSTGNTLDSCSVSGLATDAFTGVPSEKAKILLLNELKDFKDTTPVYVTSVDKAGSFKFKNIAPGKYYICAIEDNNSNYKFDLPDEKIAFLKDPIILSSEQQQKDSINLLIFKEVNKIQKRLKTELFHYNSALTAYRNPLNDPKIIFPDVESETVYFLNEKKDTLRFFVKNRTSKTLKFFLEDGEFKDTVEQTLNLRSGRRNFEKDTTFNLFSSAIKNKVPYNVVFTISSKIPIEKFDYSKIVFKKNKDTIPIVFEKADSDGFQWKLATEITPEDSCKILFKKGAALNILGFGSDSTLFSFQAMKQEEHGSLKITFNKASESPIIIQLKGKEKTYLINIAKGSAEAEFINIYPDSYKASFIVDENEDGSWTTGEFDTLTQPEKTFIQSQAVLIKAKWETKIDWNL